MVKAISFPEADPMPAYSESGIPNVRPLPVKTFDGSSTSCWQFDPGELRQLLDNGGIFWLATTVENYQPILRVTLNKGEALQPMPKALKGG